MDGICSRAAPSRKRWGKEESPEKSNSEGKKSEDLIEEVTGKRFSLNKLFKKGKDKRSSQSTAASISEANVGNVQKEEKKRWGKEESEKSNSESKKSEELIEEVTGKQFSLNRGFRKGKDKRSSQSTTSSVSEASEENIKRRKSK